MFEKNVLRITCIQTLPQEIQQHVNFITVKHSIKTCDNELKY